MSRSQPNWFLRLSDAQRKRLLANGTRRKAKAGVVVVRRGAPAAELFILLEGKAKAAIVNVQGRATTFEFLGQYDIFGEIGLFAQGVRTADVTAMDACEFLVLSEAAVLEAIREDPSIALELLRMLSERVIRLSDAIEDASALDAGVRLARSLLRLAERFGTQPLPQNLQVSLRLSQQDLADLVGVSRVFANTRLKAWEREGIMTHHNGKLVVHDLAALRRAACIE
jgi:CRP-like cAMP-binding protein